MTGVGVAPPHTPHNGPAISGLSVRQSAIYLSVHILVKTLHYYLNYSLYTSFPTLW